MEASGDLGACSSSFAFAAPVLLIVNGVLAGGP